MGTALAASFGPLPLQLAFAAATIGVIGMAHGASDLVVVRREHRVAFLALYALVTAICLLWWVACPAIALPAFLIASALHFGLEDAPPGASVERVARGVSLVATPATLHAANLDVLLRQAGVAPVVLSPMMDLMVVAGGIAAAWLLVFGSRRRDPHLLVGTLTLLMLPPLVGFSAAFLILHALPQTMERQQRIGCATMVAYLRAVWPVLLAAVLLVGAVGAAVLRLDPTGVRSLFAGIAALAMPHLLVTPWFEKRGWWSHRPLMPDPLMRSPSLST